MINRCKTRPVLVRTISATMLAMASLAAAQTPTTAPTAAATTAPTSFKFDFGSGKVAPGYTQVTAETAYTPARGYGFEPGGALNDVDRGGDALSGDLVTSDQPFLFSVAVPEGNYQVKVTLGDLGDESATTVKAELRRLMVEKADLPAGKTQTYTFNVNIRTPEIPGGGVVRLKDREKAGEWRAWDERMTLEFDDSHSAVDAIEISPIQNIPVVYLCGDSTVCDQPGELYASWGQMLPRFFTPDVVIANHAESGESLRSFLGEKRWDKVMSLLKSGDYVIIQMGHNDEKERGAGVGAFTTYKADLKRMVADARKKGATPIVVTPMERRNFEGDKIRPSHGDYPEAIRQVAKEDDVRLIDLNEMSVRFYEALGPQKAPVAFANNGRDATHQSNYGAYELAKCIVDGIINDKVDLAKSVVDDFKFFDPAHPDDPTKFTMPAGPSKVNLVPLGS